MTHELRITTDGSERSIVRTLAVIEQRGFQVSAIDFPFTETGEQCFCVCVTARDGNRSIEALARKINAMHSIQTIAVDVFDHIKHRNKQTMMMTQSMAANGQHTMKEVVQ